MTSAESALLGIVIGAALAWLGGMLNSRLQWQREQRRRQAERRAELYQDMLAEQGRLVRAYERTRAEGMEHMPGARFPDEESADREARYKARGELFASPKVRDLWEAWLDVFTEVWGLGTEYSRYSDDVEGWEADLLVAESALTAQMRAEVDPS